MVRVNVEMDVDGKIEKKEMECKFLVAVGMNDLPGLSFIPGLRGLAAECISMGNDVVVGDVVDTLAVSILEIVEGFAKDSVGKKVLREKFIKRWTESAGSTNERQATIIVTKGGH